jgi:hypothetical protein
MPQSMSMLHNLQELRARAQEMRQEARHTYQDASLAWLMPDANHLTRAITVALLNARGLLDERPAPEVRRTYTVVLFAQSGTLSHEVASLCTQARALCHEAKLLCKARPAPASWSQAAGVQALGRL